MKVVSVLKIEDVCVVAPVCCRDRRARVCWVVLRRSACSCPTAGACAHFLCEELNKEQHTGARGDHRPLCLFAQLAQYVLCMSSTRASSGHRYSRSLSLSLSPSLPLRSLSLVHSHHPFFLSSSPFFHKLSTVSGLAL